MSKSEGIPLALLECRIGLVLVQLWARYLNLNNQALLITLICGNQNTPQSCRFRILLRSNFSSHPVTNFEMIFEIFTTCRKTCARHTSLIHHDSCVSKHNDAMPWELFLYYRRGCIGHPYGGFPLQRASNAEILDIWRYCDVTPMKNTIDSTITLE